MNEIQESPQYQKMIDLRDYYTKIIAKAIKKINRIDKKNKQKDYLHLISQIVPQIFERVKVEEFYITYYKNICFPNNKEEPFDIYKVYNKNGNITSVNTVCGTSQIESLTFYKPRNNGEVFHNTEHPAFVLYKDGKPIEWDYRLEGDKPVLVELAAEVINNTINEMPIHMRHIQNQIIELEIQLKNAKQKKAKLKQEKKGLKELLKEVKAIPHDEKKHTVCLIGAVALQKVSEEYIAGLIHRAYTYGLDRRM